MRAVTLMRELRHVVALFIVGAILAFLASMFGLLDRTVTSWDYGRRETYIEIRQTAVFALLLAPYLLFIAYRLSRSVLAVPRSTLPNPAAIRNTRIHDAGKSESMDSGQPPTFSEVEPQRPTTDRTSTDTHIAASPVMPQAAANSEPARHLPTVSAGPEKDVQFPVPWRRYFARTIDEYASLALLFPMAYLASPPAFRSHPLAMAVPILLAYRFLEAASISALRTTPGKALFGIHVSNADGGRIGYRASLLRTFRVWCFGEGLWIPPFYLFAILTQRNNFVSNNTTPWDSDGLLRVTEHRIGPVRKVVAALLVLGLMYLYKTAAQYAGIRD